MVKKNRQINFIFIAFVIVYSVFMFRLFYNQATGVFYSDMGAYVLEILGEDSGYSFPYPLFFKLSYVFSLIMPVEVAIACVLSFLNILGMITAERYVWELMPNCSQVKKMSLTTIIVMTLFLVSMLFWPLDLRPIVPEGRMWGARYLGVFTPNPYQNATYLATRPFSILLLIKYVYVIDNMDKCKVSDFGLIALYMFLSTIAKPSFVFVFLPMMAVMTIVIWIKSKCKITKPQILLVSTIVPTVIVLLIQFSSVFGQNSDGGMKIGIGYAWHLWTPAIKSAFIKANFFPLVYLILHLKELKKSKMLLISWLIWLVGIGTYCVFYEAGPRQWDSNFAWGYMHGMFCVFMASIIPMFNRLFFKTKEYKWQDILSFVCLIPHLICGVLFYIYMVTGNSASYF